MFDKDQTSAREGVERNKQQKSLLPFCNYCNINKKKRR